MNKSSRRGTEQWRSIVAGQPASGLSIAAYCRKRGISQPSFFIWRRRFDKLTTGRFDKLTTGRLRQTPPFIEVKASGMEDAAGIEVHLRGGRRLLLRRGFDHDLLIELVRVLEGSSSGLEGVA